MKQRQRLELWRQLLFSALILLAISMAMTACSSDEDSISAERESLAEFFKKTFPQEKDGEGTNDTNILFAGFNEQENVCEVINSYDELKSSYQGKEPLPEVDFSKYSLVIGRAWLNVGYKFKKLTVAKGKGNTVITLHFTVLSNSVFTIMTYYYYWALCPKFTPQNLTTKIYYDN